MKVKLKRITEYKKVKAGELFMFGKTIALMTDYTVISRPDIFQSYIVGSGEVFMGGTSNVSDREELIVTVIKIKI